MATFPHRLPGPAAPAPAPAHLRSLRLTLADGAATTLHVASYVPDRTAVRVVRLARQEPLAAFCARRGLDEALVGGFYERPSGLPLGELRTRGIARRHVPFDAPWGDLRACVHVQGTSVVVDRRDRLPAGPPGDLLQAGPLLVREGEVVFDRATDLEGFSAASEQFDSDITDGRHPRAAIGIGDGHVTVVVCDGRRSRIDDGLSLAETGAVMRDLGCHIAMNLDGGGSTTLVHRGHLLNRPYSEQDQPAPASRPIVTALLLG
jgi:hypothetical protein